MKEDRIRMLVADKVASMPDTDEHDVEYRVSCRMSSMAGFYLEWLADYFSQSKSGLAGELLEAGVRHAASILGLDPAKDEELQAQLNEWWRQRGEGEYYGRPMRVKNVEVAEHIRRGLWEDDEAVELPKRPKSKSKAQVEVVRDEAPASAVEAQA